MNKCDHKFFTPQWSELGYWKKGPRTCFYCGEEEQKEDRPAPKNLEYLTLEEYSSKLINPLVRKFLIEKAIRNTVSVEFAMDMLDFAEAGANVEQLFSGTLKAIRIEYKNLRKAYLTA